MQSSAGYICLLALFGVVLVLLAAPVFSADDEHGDSHAETSQEAEHGTGEHQGHGVDGAVLPLWSAIPFVGILLSIAIFPLVNVHFWHHHFGKVSLFWALAFALPYLAVFKGKAFYDLLHIHLLDYIPFIILLWGLYTAAGGIIVRGTLRGKPVVNTGLLLIGTVIASWVGTTGASMLLIRPLIRANAHRQNKMHLIIFFIFLVSNIGGSLTPLGDPPLFLGFLHSVPFFWTFALLPSMAFVSALLLALFFAIDTIMYKREGAAQAPDDGVKEPLRLQGLVNLIFLAGIVGAVLMSGTLKLGEINVLGVHVAVQNFLRDAIIIGMGLLSLAATPFSGEIRQGNGFTWFPIVEVGKLFAGIFTTIVPALLILKAGSAGALKGLIEAVQEPHHYFWVTGILSSFLDNAPTYLTFFNTALGNFFPTLSEAEGVARLIAEHPIYLEAISAGAVFMGANTYIGNAPNFMVKSIAEESGIKMPSFFGYMLWSVGILIPLFVIVTLVFFR